MDSLGVFVSNKSVNMNMEMFIFQRTLQTLDMITLKIVLVLYSITLVISVIQTFWNNSRLDRIFASMSKTYSDNRFEEVRIALNGRMIDCYRYDQRFSFIRNPNRLILPIICIHVQVLLLIASRTVFIRRTETINDCWEYHFPSEILQCDSLDDPCHVNATEGGKGPKCAFYYFETNHLISMVTSMVTWHYALRYFIVKIVRFIRWIIFTDEDQPRRFCCCCRPTRRVMQCLMYAFYLILWIYFLCIVLVGFIWNFDTTRFPVETLGIYWKPVLLVVDRLCSLTLAVIPELCQNWLKSMGTLTDVRLADHEPMVPLVEKKRGTPIPSIDGNNQLHKRN